MKYYIDYGTGAGNFEFVGTLNNAKDKADEGIAYTQTDCRILSDGELVAIRKWYGVKPEDEEDIIQFGSFGYYDAWVEF